MVRQRGQGDGCLMVFLFVIAVAIFALTGLWLETVQCNNRWKDSGFRARYEIAGGCQILTKQGSVSRWIPEDRYREVNE